MNEPNPQWMLMCMGGCGRTYYYEGPVCTEAAACTHRDCMYPFSQPGRDFHTKQRELCDPFAASEGMKAKLLRPEAAKGLED